MLKPLPVGDHTIHMAGSVVNYAEATLNNFANEVKCHIKVQLTLKPFFRIFPI
jgi:hypothetical protein